jgi:hypothetical protein
MVSGPDVVTENQSTSLHEDNCPDISKPFVNPSASPILLFGSVSTGEDVVVVVGTVVVDHTVVVVVGCVVVEEGTVVVDPTVVVVEMIEVVVEVVLGVVVVDPTIVVVVVVSNGPHCPALTGQTILLPVSSRLPPP